MSIWYFVFGFVVSAVVFFIARTIYFVRCHYGKNLSLMQTIKLLYASEPPETAKSVDAPQESEPSSEGLALAPVLQTTVDEPIFAIDAIDDDYLEDSDFKEPFNVGGFGDRLERSDNPIVELKEFAQEVLEREESTKNPENISDVNPKPYGLELYLARELDEAELMRLGDDLAVSVVRPFRSNTFYFRFDTKNLPWGDYMRILAVEGALNRALFAWEHFVKEPDDQRRAEAEEQDDQELLDLFAESDYITSSPSLEECYQFNQALAHSITAQVGSDPIGPASMSDMYGEWGVRQAIAAGIESFRLPLRLKAKFRVNLMGGDAAIVATFMPRRMQPVSVYSETLERVVKASGQMRSQMATDYALRTALLLASHAFRCSRRLCHVFVALTLDGPTRHSCVLTGDISREALREYDLSGRFDAEQVCRDLGLIFKINDGALKEVSQSFSLDSERFCPKSRYEDVDLSKRILPRFEAGLLGAKRVSDLAINEDAHREEVAQQLLRRLTGTLAVDVHHILECTSHDADPTVQEAGKRLVGLLIDGTVAENDTLAFTNAFVSGDELNQACEKALDLINAGKNAEASEALCDVLAPLDALDVYTDTDEVVWRQFTSYVGRALYNRLYPEQEREVRLVPDAYYAAQLLQSTAQLNMKHFDMAAGFARRAQDLNPLDMSGLLRLVRCYEATGELEKAADALKEHLEIAFDLESIATCYYRLAFFEWHLGNIEVADACYQRAMRVRGAVPLPVLFELHILRMSDGTKEVAPEDVNDVLEAAGIPLAPTENVTNLLIEAAQAATDAEVFPVARSFATLLGALSGDDVMRGIANSIELDPDR